MGGTIYLKDGELVESEKIWEKDGYIHFILDGTKRVEIRYAKEIVDRIEGVPEFSEKMLSGSTQFHQTVSDASLTTDSAAASVNPNTPIDSSKKKTAADGNQGKRPLLSSGDIFHPKGSTAYKDSKNDPPDQKSDGIYAIKTAESHSRSFKVKPTRHGPGGLLNRSSRLKGIAFYDPRRTEKYWSSETAHHQTIKSAVAALAREYNRSPAWVIASMGKANDLGIIHQHLTDSINQTPSVARQQTDNQKTPVKISKNIRRAAVKSTDTFGEDDRSQIETPFEIAKDTLFYDPHRPLKYWSDQKTGHRTFTEAINALSQTYRRPPQWIEEHMGRFNKLAQIHKNLQQGLQQ